jgi:protein-tyrosine sulfotransferase
LSIVLVGGVARSGTTLLYGVLCTGRGTNPVLFETHLVPTLLRAYRDTRRRFEQVDGGQFFTDAAALDAYFAAAIRDFLEPVRVRYGSPPHIVIKSIQLTPFCLQALELLADCKVVVSVRDPRDIVASQLEIAIKERKVVAGQHREADIARVAVEIMRAYENCLKMGPAGSDRLRFVRYEDLVSRPQEVVAGLATWAGLDLSGFDPANAWAHSLRDYQADRAAGSAYVTELFGKGVSDERIGRHRRVLRADDVRVIERVCQSLMAAFGYAPQDATA